MGNSGHGTEDPTHQIGGAELGPGNPRGWHRDRSGTQHSGGEWFFIWIFCGAGKNSVCFFHALSLYLSSRQIGKKIVFSLIHIFIYLYHSIHS